MTLRPTSPERALAALMANTWREQRALAEADLSTIPAQLAELARRFVALDRRLLAAARQHHQPDSDLPTAELRAATELTHLRALEVVDDLEVEIEQGCLVVTTRPIHVAWSNRCFDVGRFRIAVDLAGEVRINSVDHLGPRPGWDHPHIQDGLPCLGNLREGILKLIAAYELALAVQVLLDFLATYTPETAYARIEGWPELP